MIHLTAPDGERHGPFPTIKVALDFALTLSSDAVFGDRVDEPGVWEIEVLDASAP